MPPESKDPILKPVLSLKLLKPSSCSQQQLICCSSWTEILPLWWSFLRVWIESAAILGSVPNAVFTLGVSFSLSNQPTPTFDGSSTLSITTAKGHCILKSSPDWGSSVTGKWMFTLCVCVSSRVALLLHYQVNSPSLTFLNFAEPANPWPALTPSAQLLRQPSMTRYWCWRQFLQFWG